MARRIGQDRCLTTRRAKEWSKRAVTLGCTHLEAREMRAVHTRFREVMDIHRPQVTTMEAAQMYVPY